MSWVSCGFILAPPLNPSNIFICIRTHAHKHRHAIETGQDGRWSMELRWSTPIDELSQENQGDPAKVTWIWSDISPQMVKVDFWSFLSLSFDTGLLTLSSQLKEMVGMKEKSTKVDGKTNQKCQRLSLLPLCNEPERFFTGVGRKGGKEKRKKCTGWRVKNGKIMSCNSASLKR